MSELSYLELHGDRIAYRDAGDGPALLLIHGMAGSSATWQAIIPQLSKKFRVIAPDLLGHGMSAKPRGDYSLGAFAVFLRDLLDELGVDRATVIGQSLGGGIAMQFAHQHRDYCERLALIGSGGLGPDLSPLLRMLTSSGIQSPRAGQMWHAYSSLSDAETRWAFLRTLRSVVDYRGQAVSALNKLHVAAGLPTVLIWGDDDRIIPVAHAYAAHDAVQGSRLEVLEGVGHFPHVEAPAAVADILEDFIASTQPQAHTGNPV